MAITNSTNKQDIVVMSAYIGSSRECRQYCKEPTKALFEAQHAKHKHQILDIKSFKDENKDYILRVQMAWQPFDKDLQTFFNKLRKEIDWIEKDAKALLLQEELKTAVNSAERRLIDLSRSIFNEKFQKVTCKEVDQFLAIKDKQENSRNFLRIQKRTEEFAFDIIDEIRRAVTSIGKGLTDSNSNRDRERDREQRQKPRYNEGNTPNEPPQPKARETRDNPQKEARHREQRHDHNGKQQERIPRKQYNRVEHERRNNRQERYNRHPPNKEEEQQSTRRPERQPRRHERREQGPREGKRPQRQPRQPRQHRQHRQNNGPRQAKTFKKLRIIDLVEGSDEFSIDVRLASFLKNLRDRDVWKVTDGSGEIKLVIPQHASFKVGSNITLSNCYVRAHGTDLQIVTRHYSTITSPEIGDNVDIGSFAKGNPYKNNHSQKTGSTFKEFTKIGKLEPGLEGIKMIAKVLSVKAKENTIQCVLGDETGIVDARFDGGNEFLKVNSTVYLRDVETEIDGQSEGTIIIIPGKRLLMEAAREQIKKVNEDNNISSRVYKVYEE